MTATRRLGRYHLVEPIGGGPTGEVYRARVYGVAGFERQFAVKRFHPEVVAQPDVATRLSAAARGYGSLDHPRIARLFEYGVAGGDTFTACALVPGLDLAQLLAAAAQPLAPGAAFALVAGAARAVGYAHGRGILHLGLAPTNLIATPDGDIKVTDFGILAPRLPPRPSDDPALVGRLGYLAPEQLVGESTSAATDVFAFGVIAFELVTGQRAFTGASPLDVEQAVLSGQPREPALPRPLRRVLQRCWARSPFERFPDARALADAIDAAIRLAPVPGGKREVAALVKGALERLEAIREQQLSGALSLPMPAPPRGALRASTGQVPRYPTPVGGVAKVVVPEPGSGAVPVVIAGAPSTPTVGVRPMPRAPTGQPMVVPALGAPEPMRRPVPRASQPSRPPGVRPPPGGDPTDEVTLARSPLDQALASLGHEPGAELAPPGPPGPPAPPVPPVPPAERTPPPRTPVPLAHVVSREPGAPTPLSTLRPTLRPDEADSGPTAVRDEPGAPASGDRETAKMPPLTQSRLLTFSDAFDDGVGAESLDDGLEPEIIVERASSRADSEGELVTPIPPPWPPPQVPAPPPPVPPGAIDAPRAASVGPPPVPRMTPSALGQVEPPAGAPAPAPRRGRRRALWAILSVVLAGGAAAAAVVAWQTWGGDRARAAGPPGEHDRVAARDVPADHRPTHAVAPAATDAGATTPAIAPPAADAGPAAVPTGTPGPARRVADAGATHPEAVVGPPVEADGTITISSKPSRAQVFIDGADQGHTPLKLTAGDMHSLALVKPGYDLFVQEVDGRHSLSATLHAITPLGGPAGIKVKCKAHHRYYVFVDGRPTGQLCPSERIHVDLGPHTVEVYDLVTESRTQYPVEVKQTRLSLRVHVD